MPWSPEPEPVVKEESSRNERDQEQEHPHDDVPDDPTALLSDYQELINKCCHANHSLSTGSMSWTTPEIISMRLLDALLEKSRSPASKPVLVSPKEALSKRLALLLWLSGMLITKLQEVYVIVEFAGIYAASNMGYNLVAH
ncbi:hypothetical protein M231_05759 [Tremella mesenterica]|uniref:Uncharacterized protein n=1 Tax=Tremella mesenterica TaxID=5217 RepID=A0A4Q1BHB9_TREME|nr:hypothetical protein M231_05759 [Tremella mesenterica]